MDIAAISATALQSLAASSPAVEPTALASEQFRALMSAAPAGNPPADKLQAAVQAAFKNDAAAPTLGGQILDGLQSAAADYSGKWQSIAGHLDMMGDKPMVSDMLRLQAELLQASIQFELVGKAVSRTTQNIDSMVRMS